MQNLKKVQNCTEAIKSLLPQGFSPAIGIVLGTGLGNLVQSLEKKESFPYSLLPDFPQSTVASHQGAFVCGYLSGVPVLLQQGRCHLYEGRSPEEVCMGVRVMGALGIKGVVITNAAGAINPQFQTGSLMLITDHINMTGKTPLTGPNVDAWGVRFPDMSTVYDAEFRLAAEKAALELNIRLERGVYFGVSGPQMETPAETRAYRLLGGDAVGMSTVQEVIAARHMGIRVLGISCLTNKNLPDCMVEASLEEVIAVAEQSGDTLSALLSRVVPAIAALS